MSKLYCIVLSVSSAYNTPSVKANTCAMEREEIKICIIYSYAVWSFLLCLPLTWCSFQKGEWNDDSVGALFHAARLFSLWNVYLHSLNQLLLSNYAHLVRGSFEFNSSCPTNPRAVLLSIFHTGLMEVDICALLYLQSAKATCYMR